MAQNPGNSKGKPTNPASRITQTDLANEQMGNNQLQGNDQESVRNQRHAVPGAKVKAEGVIESFENMDPKVRAKRANADSSK